MSSSSYRPQDDPIQRYRLYKRHQYLYAGWYSGAGRSRRGCGGPVRWEVWKSELCTRKSLPWLTSKYTLAEQAPEIHVRFRGWNSNETVQVGSEVRDSPGRPERRRPLFSLGSFPLPSPLLFLFVPQVPPTIHHPPADSEARNRWQHDPILSHSEGEYRGRCRHGRSG